MLRTVRRRTHLIHNDEEDSIDEDGPDEDVGKDAGDERGRVGHHDGSVPVDGDKGPGEGARDGRGVDEARVGIVAEVEGGQVEEVDNENDLGPGKVGADKEHDEGEVEEVVEDEVAADGAGRVDVVGVAREEVANVAGLEDEQDDPRERTTCVRTDGLEEERRGIGRRGGCTHQ